MYEDGVWLDFGETNLAVAVWDMSTIFALTKGSNHITERTQTAIDVLSLLETLSRCTTVA